MSEHRRETVTTLYDDLLSIFELQWRGYDHESIHFGYYEDGDEDAGTAMERTTSELASFADVSEHDRVLDIGCGAGGDSVWLATERGATVTGVDLVDSQLDRARERAHAASVGDRVTFYRSDFHDLTGIEDGSIDLAWAIESLSHSDDRPTMVNRLRDVLADGGRLAVADIFVPEGAVSEGHRRRLEKMKTNVGLAVAPIEEFEAQLEEAGFRDVERRDVTQAIMPGAKRSASTSGSISLLARAGSAVGLTSPAVAQYFDIWDDLHALLEEGGAKYYFVRGSLDEGAVE